MAVIYQFVCWETAAQEHTKACCAFFILRKFPKNSNAHTNNQDVEVYFVNMFDKLSLLQRLQELSFSETEYWVVAGSAMVLHGFRPHTHDIDLGCSTRLADKLEQQG